MRAGVHDHAIGAQGLTGQAAAAIHQHAAFVADSEEEAEWQETQNKARAVLRAVQMVQEGLDK